MQGIKAGEERMVYLGGQRGVSDESTRLIGSAHVLVGTI